MSHIVLSCKVTACGKMSSFYAILTGHEIKVSHLFFFLVFLSQIFLAGHVVYIASVIAFVINSFTYAFEIHTINFRLPLCVTRASRQI